MRAEEGDESVKDYANKGEQTLNSIKDSQHASGNALTRLGRRLRALLPTGSRGR